MIVRKKGKKINTDDKKSMLIFGKKNPNKNKKGEKNAKI